MQEFFSDLEAAKQRSISNIDTPQWALARIREAKEKKASVLNLSIFSGDVRERLLKFPDEIFELSGLTSLDLSGNQLIILPESISRLSKLISLDLSVNELSTLPKSISQLQNLTKLDVGFNELRTLPDSISHLRSLRNLGLSHNILAILPESIGQLQNLRSLDLSGNRLENLPTSISQLQNLTSLDLSGNRLKDLPTSVSQLQSLTSLAFRNNRLSRFPQSISQLQKLTILDLSGNQLLTVSESITELQSLIALDLHSNRLSEFPELIQRLQKLRNLNLRSNQLKTLPEAVSQLQNLTNLELNDNPLISPPIEIARRGVEAIRKYFRQLSQEGVDYIYEAKLLILGEAGAGKTTFANKILDSNYVLKEEDSTRGVDVIKWSFPIEGSKQFNVNIWDFGGQEIYHATHQFFLTRRSLYALIADTRKEDTDFYYWLNIAELLSDGSPLLIVKNEKQERYRELNERQLRGQFDGLKEIMATNLATNRGLKEVKDEIKHYIRKLPHIGSPLPKTWVRVREQLEKDQRNYISLDEYLAICKINGFNETKDSLQLSSYLHDIGVFLHFQDDALLRKTVILKPNWGTDAVYKVLDNQTIIRNLGRFTTSDLVKIWTGSVYENIRDELLQLMMKFKL